METYATEHVISPAGRLWLRLHLTQQLGPIRIKNLMDHFGSCEAVLAASEQELQQVDRIGPVVAGHLRSTEADALATEEIGRAAEMGVRIICWDDADYPPLLRQISDPPPCLYVRGGLEREDALGIAIVGSRRCSHYGLEQAHRFGESLARVGFTIISGMARGIDAAAHRGALAAGGRTLGVLGNGLSRIYPPEHGDLAACVVQSGALISELPLLTPPESSNFPSRNRIIVGLGMGLLVVEASRRSGALISARLALDYNREVFALPGRVDIAEYSAGPNGLIRDGKARLVTSLDDLLDDLEEVGRAMRQHLDEQAPPNPDSQAAMTGEERVHSTTDRVGPRESAFTPLEQELLAALREGPATLDRLMQRTGESGPVVIATMTLLELKRAARQRPGGLFIKIERGDD